jgi:uncharacterized membrane protein YeiH
MILPGDVVAWLDYGGVAVFGATGALVAARQRRDIVAFCFFAAVTGIGGGTLRDLLIGAPVFWVDRPAYLAVCMVAAAAVWILGGRLQGSRLLLWLDAVGLAAYAVLGAAKAAQMGVQPLAAVAMGILSATFGGVVRDVLAGEPSVLLRREIYVTAALLGSGVYVALRLADTETALAAGIGFLAAFGLRAGALKLGWRLPAFPGGEDKPATKAAPWTGVPPTED